MPVAIFKTVREISSEDKVHVAANLLSHDLNKKWKTKSVGEKSAYAILELEEPQQITGIDIGNEHSAYVEVLVGDARCAREDFTDLLITSSFMTPIESKNSTNINRVRCFSQEVLVESAAAKKWQLVKVVCSQPFNKHIQFGLSFIKMRVAEPVAVLAPVPVSINVTSVSRITTNAGESNEQGKKVGLGKTRFTLREDSPDSESETSVGLFNRWKRTRNAAATETISAAAAIRKASNESAVMASMMGSSKATTLNSSNCEVGEGWRRTDRVDKVENGQNSRSFHEKNQTMTTEGSQETPVASLPPKDKMPVDRQKKPTPKKVLPIPNGSASLRTELRPMAKYRPFSQLLQGIIIVISGIQNPERAHLRTKALTMGALYKKDWERGCTHLICAFVNTPKYNQVRGKGRIVTKSWIERCFTERKYLPWRRFALDTAESQKAESDEEVLDESEKPQSSTLMNRDDPPDTIPDSKKNDDDAILALYDLGNDDEGIKEESTGREKSAKESYASSKDEALLDDIYDQSTEEEDILMEKCKKYSTLQESLKSKSTTE